MRLTKAIGKTPDATRSASASHAHGTNAVSSTAPLLSRIMLFQRSVGNQAVGRLLQSGALQPKLKIGQPNDIYEQEADRVADAVMRMPLKTRESKSTEPLIQSKAGCSYANGSLAREEHILERKIMPHMVRGSDVDSGQSLDVTLSTESAIRSLPGKGQRLSRSERSFFEPRFGVDFSGVRLHSGTRAGELADALHAKAFTVGSDIVIGKDQYFPGTSEGRRLIGHELTHVMQQKSGHPQPYIQPDRLPGEKKPSAGQDGLGTVSSDEYKKTSTFRDKGKISIYSSTKIIKSADVLHTRQTPGGREKLPYEYYLLHERRVEIETPTGDKAVLTMKADKYLPFDALHADPKISPKKAVSLVGDFCKVAWTLEGEYGKGRFKDALYREYGIKGIEETVQGKQMEMFFASSFHLDETLKAKNSRDPCSLKEITEKTGPAFLYFNLTDRQQYQHIADYLDGLLADRLKSEINIRKKLEEEKKKRKPEKKKPPLPEKATEAAVEPEPKETKEITLPGWLKGILLALGILALVIGVVALVAAIIGLGAEIFAGAVFAAAFWAAFKILTAIVFIISLVKSFVNRFGESKLSGVGDFFRKLGVSLLDAFAIGEMIESFTDRSLVTGKPLKLSEEEKWKRRTVGVIAIFGAVFGVRSWLKKSPARGGRTTEPAPRPQQAEPPETAPPVAEPPTRPGPIRFGPDSEGYVQGKIFREWIPEQPPSEGWKVHVSASPDSAPQVADLVLPKLRAMNVAHKVVGTPEDLGRLGGTQAGKFITIYPRNVAEAKATVSTLDALLRGRGLTGPVISGERPLGGSGLIYTRYGGFTKSTVTSPSGEEVRDVRGTDRPSWIPDPW